MKPLKLNLSALALFVAVVLLAVPVKNSDAGAVIYAQGVTSGAVSGAMFLKYAILFAVCAIFSYRGYKRIKKIDKILNN